MVSRKMFNVKTFTLAILGLMFCCLALVGWFALSGLEEIRESSQTFKRLLDQPRNAAKKITATLEDSIADLYAIDPAQTEFEGHSLLAKQKVVWERTKYDETKKRWLDDHFSIPLYREIAIMEVSGNDCKNERVYRNALSEGPYKAQPTSTRLFPFDSVCEFLVKSPEKTFISKWLARFVSKQEQLSPGATDTWRSTSPITYPDGIIRFARRIQAQGKSFIVMLALDIRHVRNNIIHLRAYPDTPIVFPDYVKSKFSFLTDQEGVMIVHPNLWATRSYYMSSGKLVPFVTEKTPFAARPLQYSQYAAYPPVGDDLYVPEGDPQGVVFTNYFTRATRMVKSAIHAPIKVRAPGLEQPHLFGTITLAQKNIRFIEKVTAFHKVQDSTIRKSSFRFLIVLAVVAILLLVLSVLWWKKFSSPLMFLSRELVRIVLGTKHEINLDTMTYELPEFQLLAREINSMVNNMRSQSQQLLKRSLDERSVTLASQVIHDIRSPIMALDVLADRASELPEDLRVLLRQSIDQIRKMIAELQNQQMVIQPGNSIENAYPVDAVVTECIQEKQIEYSQRADVSLAVEMNGLDFGVFCGLSSFELKRILSNIINNSFEAISGPGKINVEITADSSKVDIIVIDNGGGIASDVLGRVTEKGFTLGKRHGTGLGLAHARESIERVGGSITIASTPNVETRVLISVPRVVVPDWFASVLKIPSSLEVVIVDDDPSVHAVWTRRFKPLQVWVRSFFDPEAFRAWYEVQKNPDLCILVDYEFSGSSQNGLDLIESLAIAAHSTLVSFRYAEPNVQKEAKRVGVKVLPKNLALSVPIEINRSQSDFVLIDDNSLVRDIWEKTAEQKGVRLRTFDSFSQFEKEGSKVPLDSEIFLDYNLEDEATGAVHAKKLKERGFEHVSITSGQAMPKPMPWVDTWVDKTPPWMPQLSRPIESVAVPLAESGVRTDGVKKKVAHDLRPLAMALSVAMLNPELIPAAEREQIDLALNRLKKMIAQLDSDTYEE